MVKIQAQYQLMEPIGAIWGRNKLQWWCCSVGIVTIWHYLIGLSENSNVNQLLLQISFVRGTLFAFLICTCLKNMNEDCVKNMNKDCLKNMNEDCVAPNSILIACSADATGLTRTNKQRGFFSIGIVNLMLITMMASDQTNYQIVRFVRF